MQIWSFEIIEAILRNQISIVGLDSFSDQFLCNWLCLDNVFVSAVLLKGSLGMGVTEEAWVAEASVWTIYFLINVLTAFKVVRKQNMGKIHK